MFYKKLFLLAASLSFSAFSFAQKSYSLLVQDSAQQPIAGASIGIDGIIFGQSNEAGVFRFESHNKDARISVRMLGFESFSQKLILTENLTVNLKKSQYLAEEVLVAATRVQKNQAGTYTMLSRTQIERSNTGQDLPYILNQTPGVVITSDAGLGIGYTGIRIRGTDPTRTNLSINGVPLNDAESQGTFTVNIPDFASSVENIQVQRGVGSSNNGAGAFGAAINIQTDEFNDSASAEVNTTFGALNVGDYFRNPVSEKYTLKFNTGLLNKHWNLSARLSKIKSDGFIDNSAADLQSYFVSAGYKDEKNLLKINVFSGREKTFLAWNGVPQDSLESNRTFNPIAADYADQYDQYQQDHFQIFETYRLNSRNTFSLGLHYTHGEGFFQEFRFDQSFSAYGIDTLFTGSDTINSSDLIRRRWLKNDFTGVVYNWEHQLNSNINFILGGAANTYKGEHFGEVTWAKFAGSMQPNQRYYTGYGDKNEINNYLKLNYRKAGLSGFVDLQLRFVDYQIYGITKDLINLDLDNQFTFFNPKFGVAFNSIDNSQLYLNAGIANKEPNRDDFINAAINNSTPKAERLYNAELGWKSRLQKVQYEIVAYYMYYQNQLVLTGEVNNVGEYLRINTPESYRAGLEMMASWNYSNRLFVSGNIALSQNKITSFDEVLYNYDANFNSLGTVLVKHDNTDIAFSPNLVSAAQLRYKVYGNLFANWESKFVSDQYLDNTSNTDRQLEAFTVSDVSLDYNLVVKKYIPQLNLSFRVNNLFNAMYAPNGYTFSYLIEGAEVRSNFYYPQAGRNYLFSMNFKF